MKTLILGYPDERGQGDAVLVAGVSVPQADQIKLMADAKSSGVLPEGVARLEFCTVECHNIALPWGQEKPAEEKAPKAPKAPKDKSHKNEDDK